jgi:Asp-tRNA(Asn)/Glu-tRNA(Gln) amidotransferase A subunit family amidase
VRESQVKAWVHLDRDFALAQARECDRSASRGPIHGVSFAAKDIMDTADLPTEYGSPIYTGNRPAADAAVLPLSRRTALSKVPIRPDCCVRSPTF